MDPALLVALGGLGRGISQGAQAYGAAKAGFSPAAERRLRELERMEEMNALGLTAADVIISICINPRGLAVNDTEQQFRFDFRLDGAINNNSSFFGAKETSPESAGSGADLPGCYRRRSYNVSALFSDVSAGNHEFRIYCSSNDRAIPLTNYSYTVQAYYQL